jgi:hypothetical protein
MSEPAPILSGRSVKVVIPLDPAELARLTPVEGQPRTVLRVRVSDATTLTADIATKALRKAVATVRDNGDCIAFIQGKLAGNTVSEAGLVAQVKVPKAEPAAAA